MELILNAFTDEGGIPVQFTCEGDDVSPPVEIHDPPEGAESVALIVEEADGDDPGKIHWLVWNLSPSTLQLIAGASERLEEDDGAPGAKQGRNDLGKIGWSGPCPSNGDQPHRYRFRLLAVDRELDLDAGSDREALEAALKGHVLDEVVVECVLLPAED